MKDLINKWFIEYATSFLKNDDTSPYALKYQHTFNVAKNCYQIAQLSGFSTYDTELAEVIGLLHDCGRFRQYDQYGTFNDRQSEDHAELSARIIKEKLLLKSLPIDEQEMILKAVTHHNKKELPVEAFNSRTLTFAKLIRDADKIDIYRVMASQLKNPEINHSTLFLNQSEEIAYSAPILDSIRKKKIANLEDMQTEVDFRMIQLSWVFDINFSVSYDIIKKQGHLKYLMDNIPERSTVQKELEIIKKQIDYET